MRPYRRVVRFCGVGVAATLIHAISLLILASALGIRMHIANMLAFCIAFSASMHWQQRFTFADRLQGQRIRIWLLSVIFLTNVFLSLLLGSLALGSWVIALPLVPAIANYCLLYLFSSRHYLSR